MFDLRATLVTASSALSQAKVKHALIGGFALAFHGINRATMDVDFLADGTRRGEILSALRSVGFALRFETSEVLQFDGIGNLDILLANRPLSKEMLERAEFRSQIPIFVLRPEDIVGLKIQAYMNDSGRELQDKADIQGLMRKCQQMDWDLIKKYADLFGQWPTIEEIRRRA